MRRAQEVAPASAYMAAFFGMGLYQARRYEEAVHRSKEALELDRTFPAAYQWLGLTDAAVGRHEEAVNELEKSRQFSRDRGVWISVAVSRPGYADCGAGRRSDSVSVLAATLRSDAAPRE